MSGRVVLVGAGPGDPDLLTLRALREIRAAEVLLYDALIPGVIIEAAPATCERVDVGKRGDGSRGVSQDEIVELMIRKAREGRHVVRLKGGDPFVFGRGGEEASALASAGIPFELVPGVSAALAVPAYAGIPVTDRRLSSSIAIVTGHRGREPTDRRIDWEALSRSVDTLVILMGTAWIEDIAGRILAGGRDPDTPAAAIASGSTPQQRVVSAPLAKLAERIREAGLRPPVVIVVGEIARLRDTLCWFERRPLFGRRVLVARAAGQGLEIATELLRRGAEPVSVPLLAFSEAEDPRPLRRALERLEEYDWLVFTSANAVRFVASDLDAPRASKLRVACVGAATEAAARAAGLSVTAVPEDRSQPEELVVEMRRYGSLAGRSVLFPCAAGAGQALPRALEREGARVDSIEAYRTLCPQDAAERLHQALAEGLDAVMLTSPSTVDHLFDLLEAEGRPELAASWVLACIGPSTCERLRERGFEARVVSAHQSGPAFVEALEEFFREERDGLS